MGPIEKILRKYFTLDQLESRSIAMKNREFQWQVDHGYAVLVQDKPIGRHYELTKKGKKYFDKLNKRNNVLVKRLVKDNRHVNIKAVKEEIDDFLRKHEDYDVEKELSEDMYHAYLTLYVPV
ncbi:MAG: hypothetical protein IJH61_07415 [Eubacteriaceae bacterium]|nr:hypothetical protein [Eubacteriaceae bacterium]